MMSKSTLSLGPAGWEAYYVVLLSAVLSLVIPLIIFWISRRLSRSKRQNLPQERVSEQRTNTRFFLGVNAAISLMAMVFVLVPCAVRLRSENPGYDILRSFVCLVSMGVFSGLGIFYFARKGDLSWTKESGE